MSFNFSGFDLGLLKKCCRIEWRSLWWGHFLRLSFLFCLIGDTCSLVFDLLSCQRRLRSLIVDAFCFTFTLWIWDWVDCFVSSSFTLTISPSLALVWSRVFLAISCATSLSFSVTPHHVCRKLGTFSLLLDYSMGL